MMLHVCVDCCIMVEHYMYICRLICFFHKTCFHCQSHPVTMIHPEREREELKQRGWADNILPRPCFISHTLVWCTCTCSWWKMLNIYDHMWSAPSVSLLWRCPVPVAVSFIFGFKSLFFIPYFLTRSSRISHMVYLHAFHKRSYMYTYAPKLV